MAEDDERKALKLSPGCMVAICAFVVFCIAAQLYFFGELGDVRTPGIGE